MKKRILVALLTGIMLISLTGCNKTVFDTTYTFDYAIIELPNGDIVEGNVDSWTDYEDGDQLQITINGNIYLVHSSRCVLINKR